MRLYETFVNATKKYATTKIVANWSYLVMGVVNRSTLVNLFASLQGLKMAVLAKTFKNRKKSCFFIFC